LPEAAASFLSERTSLPGRQVGRGLGLTLDAHSFIVFNRKYAVSGAQDSAIFLHGLQQSFAEWAGAAASSPSPAHQ